MTMKETTTKVASFSFFLDNYSEIAPLGQPSTQTPHSVQSSGRAFTETSSISKHPLGQSSAQIPHAVHISGFTTAAMCVSFLSRPTIRNISYYSVSEDGTSMCFRKRGARVATKTTRRMSLRYSSAVRAVISDEAAIGVPMMKRVCHQV